VQGGQREGARPAPREVLGEYHRDAEGQERNRQSGDGEYRRAPPRRLEPLAWRCVRIVVEKPHGPAPRRIAGRSLPRASDFHSGLGGVPSNARTALTASTGAPTASALAARRAGRVSVGASDGNGAERLENHEAPESERDEIQPIFDAADARFVTKKSPCHAGLPRLARGGKLESRRKRFLSGKLLDP